jgi:hypothetical protein
METVKECPRYPVVRELAAASNAHQALWRQLKAASSGVLEAARVAREGQWTERAEEATGNFGLSEEDVIIAPRYIERCQDDRLERVRAERDEALLTFNSRALLWADTRGRFDASREALIAKIKEALKEQERIDCQNTPARSIIMAACLEADPFVNNTWEHPYSDLAYPSHAGSAPESSDESALWTAMRGWGVNVQEISHHDVGYAFMRAWSVLNLVLSSTYEGAYSSPAFGSVLFYPIDPVVKGSDAKWLDLRYLELVPVDGLPTTALPNTPKLFNACQALKDACKQVGVAVSEMRARNGTINEKQHSRRVVNHLSGPLPIREAVCKIAQHTEDQKGRRLHYANGSTELLRALYTAFQAHAFAMSILRAEFAEVHNASMKLGVTHEQLAVLSNNCLAADALLRSTGHELKQAGDVYDKDVSDGKAQRAMEKAFTRMKTKAAYRF